MAIVHDVMPVFELFQPTTVEDTVALLEQYDKDAWVLAGGLDTFDWFKDRNKRRQRRTTLRFRSTLRPQQPQPVKSHHQCRAHAPSLGIHLILARLGPTGTRVFCRP